MQVLGHRGDTCEAPENTVLACRNAIQRGADGVEIDVCVTADGHVVLWHDRDPNEAIAVARQTALEGQDYIPLVPDRDSGLRRPVAALTLRELQEHYGYRKRAHAALDLVGAAPEEKIALSTLEQFAAWAASEPAARTLAFDVKLTECELHLLDALQGGMQRMCRKHPELRERRLLLLSTQAEVHGSLRGTLPTVEQLSCFKLVPDFELGGAVEIARKLGARDVSIGATPLRLWSEVRRDVIAALRERRRGALDSITVWGIDEDDTLAELVELGVDGIITSKIARARELVRARAA
ncbi:MAG TPA: glycerophosphodiester phosphodiesterase family protein [Polyangiaceae bacterium]